SWVSGGTVDWPALHTSGRPPRLVTLPTYPFARMRCWLAEPTAAPAKPEVALYERTWTPAGPAPAGSPEPGGVVLCLHDDATAPVAAAVAAVLGRVRCLHPD